MKTLYRFFSFASAVCITFGALAQSEKPDTLLKVDPESRLVITESAKGTQITVSGYGEDGLVASVFSEYPEESSVTSNQTTLRNNMFRLISERGNGCCNDAKWNVILDGVCIGLNRAVGQEPDGGLQWSKSFEISWLNCVAVSYLLGKSSISLGLGFDWRNYKVTTSGRCLLPTPDKGIAWGEIDGDAKVRYSRLKIFSLQLPLLYRLKIPKTSLYFKAGPIFNFNTYGSLKTVYDDTTGNKCEYFTKEIKPRRFTVDFFGSLSLCQAVGVYVRYSPMKVMDAAGSLNFRPLTIGIGIGI